VRRIAGQGGISYEERGEGSYSGEMTEGGYERIMRELEESRGGREAPKEA